MTPAQAENFRILIRHMETRCERDLFMESFYYSCGAPACAIGEATTIEALRKQGVTRDGQLEEWGPRVIGLSPNEKTWAWLFGRAERNAWGRQTVAAKDWAVEGRKVLAERGYSMDDGFTDFMRKVREPVALTV